MMKRLNETDWDKERKESELIDDSHVDYDKLHELN